MSTPLINILIKLTAEKLENKGLRAYIIDQEKANEALMAEIDRLKSMFHTEMV